MAIGRLAGRVLGGESPGDVPIQYEVPSEFWINRLALDRQLRGWSIPSEIEAKIDVVIEKGAPVRRHPREEVAARPEGPGPRASGSSAWPRIAKRRSWMKQSRDCGVASKKRDWSTAETI